MDPIIQDMLSPADQNAINLGLSKFTLRFADKRMERRYKTTSVRSVYKYVRAMFYTLVVVYAFFVLGESIIQKSSAYTLSRVGVLVGACLVGLLISTQYFRIYFYKSTLAVRSINILLTR